LKGRKVEGLKGWKVERSKGFRVILKRFPSGGEMFLLTTRWEHAALLFHRSSTNTKTGGAGKSKFLTCKRYNFDTLYNFSNGHFGFITRIRICNKI
jgi:hypothetical protein